MFLKCSNTSVSICASETDNTNCCGELNIGGTLRKIYLADINFDHNPETNSRLILSKVIVHGVTRVSRINLKSSNFSASIFEGPVTFHSSSFEYSEKNTSLKSSEGPFLFAKFNSDLAFTGRIFGPLHFSNCDFKGALRFYNLDSVSVVFISNCKADLVSIYKSTISVLKIVDTTVNGKLILNAIGVTTFEITALLLMQEPEFTDIHVKNANRTTCRLIKKTLLKDNNTIDGLRYKAMEMRAYENELNWKRHFWEKSLVYLNKISNNHGLSWGRGLAFTLGISVLFYTLYLWGLDKLPFGWGWAGWDSFWTATGTNLKYFIKFFSIAHDYDFMEEYGPSAGSYLADALGKIFIAYGIVQTVQAFRKLGKTE